MVTYLDIRQINATVILQQSYKCDVCRKTIVGIRRRCHNCVDFDLCDSCYTLDRTAGSHIKSHFWSAFQEPGSLPLPQLSANSGSVGVRPSVQLVTAIPTDGQYTRVSNLFLASWIKNLDIKNLLKVRCGRLFTSRGLVFAFLFDLHVHLQRGPEGGKSIVGNDLRSGKEQFPKPK
eukprot:TRINITY_DN4392_c0_g1_i6.p1 TRINITY_DN4392_c0_g1~~TRINITY_DN4392_c0_g1_i6.p1  ORF type:complete len:176 (+),score=14.75 TRINITY_DN4392_c0_g1_i6:372-899(+)